MAIKFGDGTVWGDGSVIGTRPFDYLRLFHVRIEFRTASGTDYVDETADVSMRIENVAKNQNDRYYCTIHDGSKLDIDDHDEVIVTGPDQVRMFGGFVGDFDETSQGPHFDYDVAAVGYDWLLDNPKGATAQGGAFAGLVNEVFEDMADSAIIAAVMAKHCPTIDATTHVSTIEASLPKEVFENLTPRQVMDKLCDETGGIYYVDYYKNLHYFAPSYANKPAPYQLMDNPATVDKITYFPYGNLKKHKEHGVCTRVVVEGRPQLTGNTHRWLTGDGTTRIEMPYRIVPIRGEIKPLIEMAGVAQDVGIGGTEDSLADKDVLWYPYDKYLEFAVAPPQLLLTDVYCREVQETYGVATDAAGLAKYGRHLTKRVKDESIHDNGTAALKAAALLAKWKASMITYTCTCWEPGLRAGQTIKLTNALRSMSAEELVIQSVTTRNIGNDYWAFDLTLGKYFPDTVDTIRDIYEKRVGEKQEWQETGDVESLDTSLAAGSVVFSDGAHLAEDNANLFWDDINDRFGVGTNTPAGKAHFEQDDPAAGIPVLVLDQADVDEAFLKAIGESADGDLTRSLIEEGDQASSTLKGWVMVEIEDSGGQIGSGKYHYQVYTLA